MACDYRIASDKAVFGQPEILLGIVPGGGGTQRLPRTVGVSRAKEMCITGRQVRADEALRIGLADEVVTPEELHDRAIGLAAEVAAGALEAQRLAKRRSTRACPRRSPTGSRSSAKRSSTVFHSDDSRIGVASFLEHGPGHATFTGR